MAFISVTTTFVNGTTADATEVNTNFSDIVNGLQDGTKAISVEAGTFAGTLTANGDSTIGNASTDTSTVNAALVTKASVVFNEDQGDNDFRVEGDTEANLFITDASTDRIGIGVAAPDTLVHIFAGSAGTVAAASSAQLTLENSGNNCRFQFLSPNTANGQGILFGDEDDTAKSSILVDHSADVMKFTVATEAARLDASQRMGINQTSLTHQLNIKETGAGDAKVLHLESTNATATGVELKTFHSSSSTADNDNPFELNVNAKDDGGTERLVANIRPRFLDVTATTMDSEINFSVMDAVNAGDANTTAKLSSTGVWTDASGAAGKKYEGTPAEIWGSVLDKVKSLNVSRYHSSRIPEGKVINERHVGPTAEDFFDVFGVGRDPREVKTDKDGKTFVEPGLAPKDVAGIALIACQELLKKVEALES